MPMMPAISKMVVLPNHIRKFIRATRPRTVYCLSKKGMGWSAMPSCIISWLMGPTLENRVKNSIEKAEAMIRLGI